MPRIQVGQFSGFLRRYLSMSGESNVADELAPEVSPGLTLESERPEWEFLKTAKLMYMPTMVAGAAGTASAIRIRNPLTSGVVAIVEHWQISESVAGVVQLLRQQTNTDLTTVVNPIPRDTRWGGTALPLSAIVGSQTNLGGAFGDVLGGVQLAAGVAWDFPGPFVLTPGWALTINAVVVNNSMNGIVQWLEKRIDLLEFDRQP